MTIQQNNPRRHMVTGQIMTGDVNNEEIIAALESVDRELFVPEIFKHVAYVDEDISVGNGRFLMEPLAFARMVKYAAIQKNETVLDVASGTGYSSAVLSHFAQKVVALEEDADLSNKAKGLLASYGNIECVQAPLVEGVSVRAPYDVILIQGAVEFIPQSFSDQLREGGRLLALEHVAQAKTGYAGLGKLVEYRKINNMLYRTMLHDASAPLIAAFRMPKPFIF